MRCRQSSKGLQPGCRGRLNGRGMFAASTLRQAGCSDVNAVTKSGRCRRMKDAINERHECRYP